MKKGFHEMPCDIVVECIKREQQLHVHNVRQTASQRSLFGSVDKGTPSANVISPKCAASEDYPTGATTDVKK